MSLIFISSNNIGTFSENSNAFQQPMNLCLNGSCTVLVPQGSIVPASIKEKATEIIEYKLNRPGYLAFTDGKAINSILDKLAGKNYDAVVTDFAESSVGLGRQLSKKLGIRWYTIVWDPPFSNRYELKTSLPFKLEHKIRLSLYNSLVKKSAAAFCFINEGMLKAEGVRFKKTYQLVNGVDEEIIHDTLSAQVPRRPYSICVTGRVRRDKGSLEVLRAFELIAAEFPDASLTFIGQVDGGVGAADRLVVEETLAKHPNQPAITVTGRIPFREAMLTASRHEIGLHAYSASPYLYFNQVLKVGEYQALGVVPVAIRYPGTEDIITDGKDGILVSSNRPAELAGAVNSLFARKEELARIGQQASMVLKQRSCKLVTRKMYDLIIELNKHSG